MKRKKLTPDELRALRESGEGAERLLKDRIDRITAELEAKKKPA